MACDRAGFLQRHRLGTTSAGSVGCPGVSVVGLDNPALSSIQPRRNQGSHLRLPEAASPRKTIFRIAPPTYACLSPFVVLRSRAGWALGGVVSASRLHKDPGFWPDSPRSR